MTRGIHLKQITDSDLELLGLEERSPEGNPLPRAERKGLLAEVDPVLFRVVGDVRRGLEGTLQLLEEALAPANPSPSGAERPGERGRGGARNTGVEHPAVDEAP
jgi:hypothetical protein